jgi:hypothetical protein
MEENNLASGQNNNYSNYTNNPVKRKGGRGILILIIIIVLLLAGLGGAGWYVLKSAGKIPEGKVTAVPTEEYSLPSNTPIPTQSSLNKSNLKVEVLNASGVAGEAAYVKGKLQELGYSEITTGNAPSGSDKTETVVTFSSSLDEVIKEEVTNSLNSLYQDVTTKTASLNSSDIQILVGLRKGQSVSPTSKVSTTPTLTPKVTTTKSPTPTP